MNKFLLLILALGTALSASTIYLSQPLLEVLHIQFNSSIRNIGMIITLTQIGYALGILFLAPLGDIFPKKKLILIKLVGIVFMLLLVGLSQTLNMFIIASFAIGIFATAAQDFIPLAADLAPETERGRIIGTVVGGLLFGILLSRTFSGIIAQHFVWRWVFFISAIFIFIIFILTAIIIPNHPPKVQLKYVKLIQSMQKLLTENSVLQLSIVAHGFIAIVFSAFWTILTFHLSSSPFHLSTSDIGLFGLAGAAGAVAAPIAGRFADKKGPLLNIKISISFVFFSFILMLLFQNSLIIFIIGVVLFDLGTQVSLISHQAIIYAMNPHARARINSLFITGLFIFFSIGSSAGSVIYTHSGWSGVMMLSLICCVFSFLSHLILVYKYKIIAI